MMIAVVVDIVIPVIKMMVLLILKAWSLIINTNMVDANNGTTDPSYTIYWMATSIFDENVRNCPTQSFLSVAVPFKTSIPRSHLSDPWSVLLLLVKF